jgi:hypothetical protein
MINFFVNLEEWGVEPDCARELRRARVNTPSRSSSTTGSWPLPRTRRRAAQYAGATAPRHGQSQSKRRTEWVDAHGGDEHQGGVGAQARRV